MSDSKTTHEPNIEQAVHWLKIARDHDEARHVTRYINEAIFHLTGKESADDKH